MEERQVDPASVDWERVQRSRYVIHQRISYRYDGPVRSLHQRLVVQPRHAHGDQRRISRHLHVLDATPGRIHARADGFGNAVVDVSIPVVEEGVTFVTSSIVERDARHGPHLVALASLNDRRLRNPTRLTMPDQALEEVARELRSRGLTGASLAYAANQSVFDQMRYAPGRTSVRTTAAEAFAQRAGVCQDYAHVLLAVVRRLGLPSRYVSGQLLGTGGSHAWVEVLVPRDTGDAEVLSLDPTHGCSTGFKYITVAVGRDYADVAPLSGTYCAAFAGSLTATKRVSVTHFETHSGGVLDEPAVA
ncbi:MAG: transglutaminase family protein [Candidatus Dormibacteria bacterium]